MGIGQVLKKIDAFPKLIDIEVNKTFSGAFCKFIIESESHIIICYCFSGKFVILFLNFSLNIC